MKDGNYIEYVYAADGTRLKATHNWKIAPKKYSSNERYYYGNLIFDGTNLRTPYTVLFPGGFYMFEGASQIYIQHLYVQDYQGNNRVVIMNDIDRSFVTTQTHYYPYGGIIGDLSTASSYSHGCDYKYSGKELDRAFGLDWHDFLARQYDAGAPWFTRPDDHAENYFNISPYVYCAGNPVNCIDPDGKDTYLFATELPVKSEILSSVLRPATHTFIVVKHSNGNPTYAVYGKDRESGSLKRQSFSQDKKAFEDYFNGGKPNDKTKGVYKIPTPEGMSSEEFDKKVVETINSFGNNPYIKYSLYPGEETEGNCNSSTSTILLNSGVSPEAIEQIESEMPGINWGFSSTPKPWTEGEQQKAVDLHQKQIKEEIQRLETLNNAL